MSTDRPGENRRLAVLRNVDLLADPAAERKSHEFEVWTDAHIVGDYNVPPYHLGIWEFSTHVGGGAPQRFYLRVEHAVVPVGAGPASLTWDSNPPMPIAAEFTIMASLFLRRRFRLGAQVREGDTPRWVDFSAFRGPVNPALLADGANLGTLAAWFEQLAGLVPAVQPRFLLAARMYHQALRNIESAPDLAYLYLVSAVESLSRHHSISAVPFGELDEEFAELVSKVNDEELRAEFEKAVRKRNWHIKRKFVEFVTAHLEEEFWAESSAPEHGKVRPSDLRRHLGGIYDQRSLTLHTGAQFPAYLLNAPTRNDPQHGPCEIEPVLAVYSGSEKWTKDRYIPYVHFFERLVNHVLKVYIKRNRAAETGGHSELSSAE